MSEVHPLGYVTFTVDVVVVVVGTMDIDDGMGVLTVSIVSIAAIVAGPTVPSAVRPF